MGLEDEAKMRLNAATQVVEYAMKDVASAAAEAETNEDWSDVKRAKAVDAAAIEATRLVNDATAALEPIEVERRQLAERLQTYAEPKPLGEADRHDWAEKRSLVREMSKRNGQEMVEFLAKAKAHNDVELIRAICAAPAYQSGVNSTTYGQCKQWLMEREGRDEMNRLRDLTIAKNEFDKKRNDALTTIRHQQTKSTQVAQDQELLKKDRIGDDEKLRYIAQYGIDRWFALQRKRQGK